VKIPKLQRPSSLAFHRDNTTINAAEFSKSTFHHGGHFIALISVTKLIWSLPLLHITNRIMVVATMPAGLAQKQKARK
jgi:hypothetical protein